MFEISCALFVIFQRVTQIAAIVYLVSQESVYEAVVDLERDLQETDAKHADFLEDLQR